MTCLGLILAGGAARRMGGRDKATLLLAGRPLIAHVRDRLTPQVDGIALSGRQDYGLGLSLIRDRKSGVRGPAAGIAAALDWCAKTGQPYDAILTVPVDGPFLPVDLAARLAAGQGAAIASSGGRAHPTFGYWPLAALERCRTLLERSQGLSLMALADAAGARRVELPDPATIYNINGPDDLVQAERMVTAGCHAGRRS